jgi:uncharacterized protein (TIGR03435 family)
VKFEVASIRPNNSSDNGSSVNGGRGEIMMRNVTLKQIVMAAYDIESYSMSGPDWLDTVRFDVTAKKPPDLPAPVEPEARRAQQQAMLQALLADRFKLVVHREAKVLPAYALVVAKGGLKIEPVEADGSSGMSNNNGRLTATKVPMEGIARWLSRRLDRPVVDKTDVKGVFSFKLEFSREQALTTTGPGDGGKLPDNSDSAPTIFTALQEQVGLKLQTQKLPVELVVIDHIERIPTEN